MKKLIIALAIIIPSFAFCDSIHYGVFTAHFKNNDSWNNDNYLIAIEKNNYFFASFVNSYGFQTYALGRELPIHKNVTFVYGASYGYDPRCLIFIDGICSIETYTAGIIPTVGLKGTVRMGDMTLSAMAADYVNITFGYHF